MEVNSPGFHLPGPLSKVVAKYRLVKYLHFIVVYVLLVIFGFSDVIYMCIHAANFRTLDVGESCRSDIENNFLKTDMEITGSFLEHTTCVYRR
jgi:hypothetical protein